MITFRHLRYFEALARLRHFGKAAEACSISQPALSMQIQELELRLGAPLVERRRGEALLTPLGEKVAERAASILLDVRDLTDMARHGSGMLQSELALGAIPSVAPYLLPCALPMMRDALPDLQVTLRETLTQTLQSALLAGELDMMLIALPLEHPDIMTRALFRDPFILASPANAALGPDELPAPGALVAPEDLGRRNILLLEEGHCFRDQALAVCSAGAAGAGGGATKSGGPRAPFGASSLATLTQLVANDYGATLLPMLALPVEVGDDARIQVQRFAEPEPARTIAAAWRRSTPRAAEFEDIARLLRAAALTTPGVSDAS